MCLVAVFCTLQAARAQLSETEFKLLTTVYNDQYKNLLRARGINAESYFSSAYMNQNDPAKISSILKNYYKGYSPSSIAALIYFYYEGSFFVYLANQDSVSKLSQQKIELSELLTLNDQFIRALQVHGTMNNRSPIYRSSIKKEEKKATINLDSVTKKASALLLPQPEKIFRYQHLIIVPCNNLGAFPFYLLKPNNGVEYLVDKLSYSIAPSLIEVEAGCKKNLARLGSGTLGMKQQFEADNALLVANPSYPKNSSMIFPDLPGAKKEIDGSLKFFANYTYYSDTAATKRNVLRNFRNHDLLYFATHGVSSSSNPMDSCFLVFAGEKDPFFTNKEILQYKDSAAKMKLVILSACQTGLGKSMDAGIIGLSRIFQIAGANHVVMSLWNVDDEATAFLMKQFLMYAQLPSNFFPAEPLRKAILATKKRYADPSKWASFAVFGVPY